MIDLAIIETGNGGDLKIAGNDFAVQNSWGNMIYLAMFGGNKGAITREKQDIEEQDDWWGNTLLFRNTPAQQMNSYTQFELENVSFTSSGRIKLQKAIEKDIEFMSSFAITTVSVSFIDDNKVEINIKVEKPETKKGLVAEKYTTAIFIWDSNLNTLGDFSFQDFNDDFFV
jgi:hypothetical protein